MSNPQLACVYAALLLSENGNCSADAICKVTKAAGVPVSQGMAAAFANAFASVSVEQVLGSISFGGASAGAASGSAAAPAAGGAAAPAAAAAKKEEPEEEGDDDMGFGLFD